MTKSLRQIAIEMDPLADGHSSAQLGSVLKQHRWLGNTPSAKKSLREVVRRHSESESIRFLSYNTYLLHADIPMPDPFPAITLAAKPALHTRAGEIGQTIRAEYDFASLYEVMQEQQRREILSAWGPVPPEDHFGGTLSSLFAISQKFRVGRRERHIYADKGKSYHIKPFLLPSFDVSLDSDFYANKGVLLTEIVTPAGTVEVFSTHLMFGGGLGDTAETLINIATPFGEHISESSSSERLVHQMNQLDELIAFYRQQHHQDNVAIICGDFNIDGSNADNFGRLKNRLAAIRMNDVWADGPFKNNLAGGQTARNDDDSGKPIERNFDNICTELANGRDNCDDAKNPRHPPPLDCVGRFDYIFVEDPHPDHKCILDLSRVRRRQFRRSHETEGQFFLSDHLGLETTLFVTKLQR